MRVLFSCTPGEGHFLPLVPLARAAASRGHTVAFATAADRAPRVAAEGFEALAAGIPGSEAQRRFAPRLPTLQLELLPIEERRHVIFGARFGEIDAPAKLDDLRSVVHSWQPDLVVHESSDLSAPIAASEAGLASVHHGFGRTIPTPAVRRAADIVAPLWRACGLDADEWAGLYGAAYVDVCPPSVQSEPPPSHARVQPMRAAERGRPRETLRRPLVYATLGTVFNDAERFKDMLAAFDGVDCAVLLTVGHSIEPSALGPIPANVRVEQYVPQGEVLPDAAAVMTHGGSGSTWGALAHGCPLVLLPAGADQYDNAIACSRAGAAVMLLPGDQTAEKMREALEAVLEDPTYRASAERIADEIEALPGADEVAANLEEWARISAD